MKRTRRASSSGQLSLGIAVPRGARARSSGRLEAAVRALAGIGYEIAPVALERYRVTIEAELRDWSIVLERRDDTLVARVYVMRAPRGDDARAHLLEALLSHNARTSSLRFALDAHAVVADTTLDLQSGRDHPDAVLAVLRELVATCNERYPQLLAVVAGADIVGESVLRVA